MYQNHIPRKAKNGHPQFFIDHKGGKLRFSQNGTDFTDTGLKLVAPKAPKKKSPRAAARPPLQDDVLK